jgi:hypothetical protein
VRIDFETQEYQDAAKVLIQQRCVTDRQRLALNIIMVSQDNQSMKNLRYS